MLRTFAAAAWRRSVLAAGWPPPLLPAAAVRAPTAAVSAARQLSAWATGRLAVGRQWHAHSRLLHGARQLSSSRLLQDRKDGDDATQQRDAPRVVLADLAPELAQLPYRRRSQPNDTDVSRWTSLDFLPWTSNISVARSDAAKQNYSALVVDSSHAPELWECGADGKPTRKVDLPLNILLRLTAASAALKPVTAGLLQMHEGDLGMPRAFVLFTLPPSSAPAPTAAAPG